MISRMASATVLFIIRCYQRFVSPILPPMCRYEPTCSEYMATAIRRKGFIRGFAKGLWRIMRCHPFAQGGWDPVDDTDKPKYLKPE